MDTGKYVDRWVELDNKHRQYLTNIDDLKKSKKEISEYLANKTDFKYANINDGKIYITTRKLKQPLTFKFLELCLNNIISDKEQVGGIINYIKSRRTVNITTGISRSFF